MAGGGRRDDATSGVVGVHPWRLDMGTGINIELSPGVEPVATTGAERVFMPVGRWQPANLEGGDTAAHGTESRVSDVFLLTPPAALLSGLRAKLLAAPPSSLNLREISPDLPAVAAGIESWINSLGLPFGLQLRGSNVAIHGPSQRSTAYDAVNREFRGLHIDDHEKLPLDRRDEGFLLFNVNLGVADRYFLFVDRTVQGLLDLLRGVGHDAPTGDMSVKDIKTLFFERYPRYPIHRVVLRPLHAYLCQTQNVIHDGATNSAGHPDISYLVAFRVIGK